MRLDESGNAAAVSNNNSGSVTGNQQKECPICNAMFSNNIGLSNHMRSHYTASSATNAALAVANRMTPKSLTITATSSGPSTAAAAQSASTSAATSSGSASAKLSSSTSLPPAMLNQTPQEQAVFRRSLDQAADRRFRRMRCRICQRRFSSKKSYRYHMLTDHQVQNVQFIKCKLCNAEFAYEKGLKVHLFKVHGTVIKDEMIVKQFECEVCSIVYSSEMELQQHKRSVHKLSSAELAAGDDGPSIKEEQAEPTPSSTAAAAMPLYWYQCKYCPSNFNTNKKLAIHINSHDEFDSNDYSCKDCGNVYSGRKSLWVHRYKKHPQVPDPAECVLCRKIFFDRQMLDNHTPTCNRKPITATGAHQQDGNGGVATTSASASRAVFKHKTGDDDDDEEDQQIMLDDGAGSDSNAGGGGGGTHIAGTSSSGASLKIRIPEVACTICGARFTDQEMFSKHIQKHEQDLYTDNPLAAMFDDGPADPGQFYLERQNENGEYACDLCAKTFPQVIALKVHRKWHFRGDSKQNPNDGEATANVANSSNNNNSSLNSSMLHLRELHAVGLMPNQQQQQLHKSATSSSSKSLKRKRELKCEYCSSTFISNNNLRRHMYELHKHEVSNLPEPPVIEVDAPLSCRRCNLKFDTKELWIEHKLADAKVTRPFCPFQWGCDLCGEYLSRKEKLINHINNHLKEDVIVPVVVKPRPKTANKMSSIFNKTGSSATATAQPATTATSTKISSKTTTIQSRDDAEDEAEDDDEGEVEVEGEGEGEAEGDVDDSTDDEEIETETKTAQQQQQQQPNMLKAMYDGEEEEDEDSDMDDDDGDDDSTDDEDTSGDDEDDSDEEEEEVANENIVKVLHNNNNTTNKNNSTTIDDDEDDDDLIEQVDEEMDEDVNDDVEEIDEDDDDEDDSEDDDEEIPYEGYMHGQNNTNRGHVAKVNGKKQQEQAASSEEESDVDGDVEIDGEVDGDADEDVEDDEVGEEGVNEADSDGDGDGGDATSSSESESTTSHSTGERRKNATAAAKNTKANAVDKSNNSSYTCDLCQLCFDSQEQLQTHIKSHFLNGPSAANRSSNAAATNNNTSKTTITTTTTSSAGLETKNLKTSATATSTAAATTTTAKTTTTASN
ncbi:zinc finger protein hangover isoform X4 [Scaptodrosophila lebanonensis]|nr:zinc finger protein hangover isoform X4 [Scaptodrosophila lebanonensis]